MPLVNLNITKWQRSGCMDDRLQETKDATGRSPRVVQMLVTTVLQPSHMISLAY